MGLSQLLRECCNAGFIVRLGRLDLLGQTLLHGVCVLEFGVNVIVIVIVSVMVMRDASDAIACDRR